jgi:hypothetical protein
MFTKRLGLIGAAAIAIMASTPAFAAEQFTFNFSTVTPLIGGPGSGSGTITTSGTTIDSRGFTAQMITAITGTFNGSAITGFSSLTGANNLFYLTGPSFVDGSGLGFTTAAGTSVNLFYQSSASSYRINTTGPFTSSFVSANAAAVTAAVPEPATWAMMLFGFGAIGFSVRRKRGVSLLQAA